MGSWSKLAETSSRANYTMWLCESERYGRTEGSTSEWDLCQAAPHWRSVSWGRSTSWTTCRKSWALRLGTSGDWEPKWSTTMVELRWHSTLLQHATVVIPLWGKKQMLDALWCAWYAWCAWCLTKKPFSYVAVHMLQNKCSVSTVSLFHHFSGRGGCGFSPVGFGSIILTLAKPCSLLDS